MTADNGDLYLIGYRGMYGKPTNDDVHGVVFRIKAGEYDFDEGYLLDLSEKMGETTQIMQLNKLTGQNAMAMLFDDSKVQGYEDLDNDHYYYVKINLANQEVAKINMPRSDIRLARKPLVDGNYFISYIKSAANNTTNVLKIDFTGGADSYVVGKKIEGDNVQGYSVVKHPTE